MPVVGRQHKNLKYLPDACAGCWRTTQKLAMKREFMIPRYCGSLFYSENAVKYAGAVFYCIKEMKMKHTYSKKEALRVIIATAKEYEKMLAGKNYLFIYRNRDHNQIEFFETVFLPRNFQHLTGIEFLDKHGTIQKNSVFFYHKCLNNTITENEIQFKTDGTTPLKLAALPKLVQFLRFSKMTALYNGIRPKLAVDRVAGTTNYCLGFVKDGNYFVPNSCLLEDIRNLGERPSQILAILSKSADRFETVYRDIRYLAKGIHLEHLKLTDELNRLISLEHEEKNK